MDQALARLVRQRAQGLCEYCHMPEEFDRPTALRLDEKIARSKFVVAVSEFGRSQLFRWCAPQHRPKPPSEWAPQDGAESARALLAAPHLAAERGKRPSERQPALVVAPVERRDQHDPQPREREGRGRRHTSM